MKKHISLVLSYGLFMMAVAFSACSSNNEPESKVSFEPVDMGVSVKWAPCNVGANAPEEYGWYLAWGVTAPTKAYSWEFYKWCEGSMSKLTKYCSEAENGMNGFVDNKKILDPEDDAATVNWGKKWRTPTYDEIKELRDNCEMDNVEVNGVPGKLFTSKTTGNTLFFPFTGNTGYKPGTGATEAYEVLGAGESTSLWASTRSEVSQYAGGYYITDWMTYLGESPRETGCVVRPVYCE